MTRTYFSKRSTDLSLDLKTMCQGRYILLLVVFKVSSFAIFLELSQALEKQKYHVYMLEKDLRSLEVELHKQQKYFIGMMMGINQDYRYVYSFKNSRNSDANASEFLDYFENMLSWYYMISDVRQHVEIILLLVYSS